MFNWLLSLFRPRTVDGIISDINNKISELTRLEGEKLEERDDLFKQANQLMTKSSSANAEAQRARAISQRLESLVKFDVA